MVRSTGLRQVDAGNEHPLLHKLALFLSLSEAEQEILTNLRRQRRAYPAASELLLEGDPTDKVYLLEEGWAYRFKLLSDGRRQILSIAIPGDFIGVRSGLFGIADHAASSLGEIKVAVIPVAEILDLYRDHPRLATAVSWTSAHEETMLVEHIVRLGRRNAYERSAHFLLELLQRLQAVGLSDGRSFNLPVTQEFLGDLLGLSVVHVNRTLRRLRSDGLLTIEGARFTLRDVDALVEISDFESSHLVRKTVPARVEAMLGAIRNQHRSSASLPPVRRALAAADETAT